MPTDLLGKVVRLGTLPEVGSIFCTIKYENGKLSITGVEGPKSNGDCRGSCGQIEMHLREPDGLTGFEPAPCWTPEMVHQFLKIWDRWHLNDMCAYDDEMEAAGWAELARKPILRYTFQLNMDAIVASNDAEKAAKAALKAGVTFTPTPEQTEASNRPYWTHIYAYPEDEVPQPPEYYEVGGKHPERKTLGWLRHDEHPDGLLGRKLRPDGHAYGSAWIKRDIPDDVIQWLANLPDTDRSHPWGDR